jgi:hypothetical protein
VPVWKAEQRLSVVWVPATWVAEPSTSLWRDLGVGVWSLSQPGGGFWVEVVSWIWVKALSPVVAGANGVDALGRRFLLEGAVVVKLLPLP